MEQGGPAKVRSLAWAVVASLVSGWTGFIVEAMSGNKNNGDWSPFLVLIISLCVSVLMARRLCFVTNRDFLFSFRSGI